MGAAATHGEVVPSAPMGGAAMGMGISTWGAAWGMGVSMWGGSTGTGSGPGDGGALVSPNKLSSRRQAGEASRDQSMWSSCSAVLGEGLL